MRFLVFILLAATLAPAQAPNHDKLRFTLILSRHGVRPPLVAAADLNIRSSDPWPEWEVPLGYLTPHGALAIRQMGAYMRTKFAENGLFPATGCPASGDIYLHTDIDERNVTSASNTFAAFAPGCDPIPVHITATPPDALFFAKQFPPIPDAEAKAARDASEGHDPAAFYSVEQNPALAKLASILAPNPDHPAAKPILDEPHPLATASPLLEDLYLEYVDDKPMSEVGWGRLDEATLYSFFPLRAKAINVHSRPAIFARANASNLAEHIAHTLEQAAEGKPVPGAIGPAGTRLVYMSAHDSNMWPLAGLLGLHWDVDGRHDDTPPDSQLAFDLLQNAKTGAYTVRIRFLAQTTQQLRTAAPLTASNPPFEMNLKAAICDSAESCPLATFVSAIHASVDPTHVMLKLQPSIVAK